MARDKRLCDPPLETPPAEEAYELLRHGFERAMNARGDAVRTTFPVFAGRSARLRIVGKRLAGVVNQPFAHLSRRKESPESLALTVDLWDEEETRVGCNGAIAFDDLSLPAAIDHSFDGLWVSHRKAQVWIAFGRGRSHIVGWVRDERRLTPYQRARPLHSELLLWHSDREVCTAHAGFVAMGGRGGVLLAGPGGAGKSSTALTCLQAGFTYLADDWVGIQHRGGDHYLGHSFICSTAVAPHDLEKYPALVPHVVSGPIPGEGKLLIHLAEVWPERMGTCASIRAVVLPRVRVDSNTRLSPAPKSEALVRIASSSLPLHPDARIDWALAQLGKLVDAVPTYWLELGRDPDDIPVLLERLLAPYHEGAG